MKRRVYTDTSVIGGCLEDEFRDGSLALFDAFRAGTATIVVSDIVLRELAAAPQAVLDIFDSVPKEYREIASSTDETDSLAEAYVREGAVSKKHMADAQHIAIATINRVDALASWNFKHMVNPKRIGRYNGLNSAFGHGTLKIHTPTEALNHED